MAQLGNVPSINAVKNILAELKDRNLVKAWEIPYEQILTRLSAAVFFLTPAENGNTEEIWKELDRFAIFHYRLNEEKKLSQLEWRIECRD